MKFSHVANDSIGNEIQIKTLDSRAQWSCLVGEHLRGCMLGPQGEGKEALCSDSP